MQPLTAEQKQRLSAVLGASFTRLAGILGDVLWLAVAVSCGIAIVGAAYQFDVMPGMDRISPIAGGAVLILVSLKWLLTWFLRWLFRAPSPSVK